VPVERLASSVVALGGARVGVAGCFLDVPQRNAGVECSSDERVPQGVRTDALGDPRLSGDATHDPSGGVTIEALPSPIHEDRALEPLVDRQVEGPGNPRRERHGHDLAALAGQCQGPMTSLQAERVDVRAKASETRRPLSASSDTSAWSRADDRPSSDQQHAELVAIQAGRVGLVVCGGRRLGDVTYGRRGGSAP